MALQGQVELEVAQVVVEVQGSQQTPRSEAEEAILKPPVSLVTFQVISHSFPQATL